MAEDQSRSSVDDEAPDHGRGHQPRRTQPPRRAETAAAPEPGLTHHDDLMRELARAMHTAIDAQVQKVNAELEARRAEQVQAIAVRASVDVEHLKGDSQAAIKAIDAWARAENDLIKRERERRIDARRERLASQLDLLETIRGRQVFAVEVAIDAHRSEVEAIYEAMGREWDPAAIVRILSTLPDFPSLSRVIEDAGRVATAEYSNLDEATEPGTNAFDVELSVIRARLLGVMDPDATRPPDGETARPWDDRQAVGVGAGARTHVEAPVAEPALLRARVGGPLIRSIPSTRPMAGRFDEGVDKPGTTA